jgi:hypothetical protein
MEPNVEVLRFDGEDSVNSVLHICTKAFEIARDEGYNKALIVLLREEDDVYDYIRLRCGLRRSEAVALLECAKNCYLEDMRE